MEEEEEEQTRVFILVLGGLESILESIGVRGIGVRFLCFLGCLVGRLARKKEKGMMFSPPLGYIIGELKAVLKLGWGSIVG